MRLADKIVSEVLDAVHDNFDKSREELRLILTPIVSKEISMVIDAVLVPVQMMEEEEEDEILP